MRSERSVFADLERKTELGQGRSALSHGYRKFHTTALLLIQFMVWIPWVGAYGDAKPPRDLAEAQKWFKESEESAGRRDIEFHLDASGTVTWKTKDNQAGGFYLATVSTITLARDGSGGAWRVSISFLHRGELLVAEPKARACGALRAGATLPGEASDRKVG